VICKEHVLKHWCFMTIKWSTPSSVVDSFQTCTLYKATQEELCSFKSGSVAMVSHFISACEAISTPNSNALTLLDCREHGCVIHVHKASQTGNTHMATDSLSLKMWCYFCATLYLHNFSFLKKLEKSRVNQLQKFSSLCTITCIITLQVTKTE
jgi:hypothetical protein